MEKCLKNLSALEPQDEATTVAAVEKNFWSLFNVKKAFLPKLIALLRSHANGNANVQNIEIIYSPCLSLILEKLNSGGGVFVAGDLSDSSSLENEKLAFYRDILGKLFDAVVRDTANVNSRFGLNEANKSKKITTFFDCLVVIVQEFVYKKNELEATNAADTFKINIQFCSELIFNYVRNIDILRQDNNFQIESRQYSVILAFFKLKCCYNQFR
jgi:hypothetical protein